MIRDIPVLGVAVALVGDILLSGGDVLLALLEGLFLSLGDILPIVSIISGIVAPEVDWIPEGTASMALLVIGLLVIGIQIARLVESKL